MGLEGVNDRHRGQEVALKGTHAQPNTKPPRKPKPSLSAPCPLESCLLGSFASLALFAVNPLL
jgi:hypothetical protein